MKQRRRRGFLASDEGLKKLGEKMLQKGYTQEKLVEVASVSLDQVKKLLNPHWGRRIQKDAISGKLDWQKSTLLFQILGTTASVSAESN